MCIAKTQYSFSADPDAKCAPVGHIVPVADVRLSAGAEFIVILTGSVMTMPGLPKSLQQGGEVIEQGRYMRLILIIII